MRFRYLAAAILVCVGLMSTGHAQFLAESLGFNDVPCEGATKPTCGGGGTVKVNHGICYQYECARTTACPAVATCPEGSKATRTTDANGCEKITCGSTYKTSCATLDTVQCPASQKPLATENYDQNGCTIFMCQSEQLVNVGHCPSQPTCGAGYMRTYVKMTNNCAEVACRGINKTTGAACPVPMSCPAGYDEVDEVWHKDCPTKRCRAKEDGICRSKVAGTGIVNAKQCPRLFGLPAMIESHETLPAPKAPVIKLENNFGGR